MKLNLYYVRNLQDWQGAQLSPEFKYTFVMRTDPLSPVWHAYKLEGGPWPAPYRVACTDIRNWPENYMDHAPVASFNWPWSTKEVEAYQYITAEPVSVPGYNSQLWACDVVATLQKMGMVSVEQLGKFTVHLGPFGRWFKQTMEGYKQVPFLSSCIPSR